jgi:hypothetical protein
MTMSEFAQILARLDGQREQIAQLHVKLEAHCAAEEALAKRAATRPAWLSAAASWVAAAVAVAALLWR